jgi:hypothetical protein
LCACGLLLASSLSRAVAAAERELEDSPPPGSAREIKTPIERLFPPVEDRPPLIPWFGQKLQELPPFFADTRFEVKYRTAYIRQGHTVDVLSEAWAMGGSLYYHSGWLAETFAIEIEGFTSQPIVAPKDRPGTDLLTLEQKGYSALGIANGKLRYKSLQLTGFRQYFELPYMNRNDSRMTPNTFESLTLEKLEGDFLFSTGYSWRVKLRTSDEFESFTEALGLDEERGLAHAGVVWDPNDRFHLGTVGAVVPDLFAGLYAEVGVGRTLANGWQLRLDGQFTHQWEVGEDLLGIDLEDAWNLGLRASASFAGAVFRLGFAITGPDAGIFTAFGSSPSYVDLMQRGFNRADEKAVLASVSYDFSQLGAEGLSAILNYVGGFDGKLLGKRGQGHELDLTVDYKIGRGWLESLWLRVRGSWITERLADQDGSDVRVILRYAIPVI